MTREGGYTRPQERPAPDRASAEWPALDSEPPQLDGRSFRQLAVNCSAAGASDITLQTDQPPRCQIGGIQFRIGRRPLAPSETDSLLAALYGGHHASTLLASRKVLDFSFSIPLSRSETQRYRINATAVLAQRGGAGCELSIRSLPRITPNLEDVGLGSDLLGLLSPPSGLVIIAGATGQGKSTTLAAILREHLKRRVKIIDIQAPIEFAFTDLGSAERGGSSLGQSEVGTHVETFADGVRSALRRAPDILVIGETRDAETARAAVDAAMTGHLVYTTLHAGDAPECFRRLTALLATASGERSAAVDILQTFRAAVAQRLLPAAEGLGRTPVREIAVLSGALRRALTESPPDRWPSLARRALDAAAEDDPGLRPYRRDLDQLSRDGLADPAAVSALAAGL